MIIHEHVLLSEDLFEKQFICDLNACKGSCCVEGDFGAPLEVDEPDLLLKALPNILPYLTPEAIEIINHKGISETDKDGDLVTTCTSTGECVFAIKQQGILGCGIEKAWKDGAIQTQKPISCHLYPIRISKVGDYDALNYHRWDICKPACILGEKHKMPVYKFLETALVRKYGQAWFNELDEIANAINKK